MNAILEFIYCMFYVCSATLCVYPFFDRKPKKIELFVFIFLYSFVDFIITQNIFFDLHVFYIQSILVIMSDFLMICLLNKTFKLYIFYYTIMFYNIFNCCVVFISYLLNYFNEFDILLSFETSVLRFCLVTLFNLSSILLYYLFYKYKIISKKSILKENYKILIFINLSVQFAFILFQWFNEQMYVNEYMHIILLIFIILWILLLYALNHVFILNDQNTKAIFMNGIDNNIEQYIKYYQQDEERIRKLIHDIKNHFIIIRSLKGEENIHQYIDKVYPELEKLKVLNTSQSGNIYIDAIINSKRLQYPYIELICEYNISQLKVNDADLSMLLFNLMDNACSEAEKVHGEVKVRMEYVEPHFMITILNTKDGEVNFYSQKGSGHGYGMKIINEIVEKYHGKIEYQVLEKEVKVNIIMIINKAN